ncbi:hypothetical protein L6164_019204 [Bauhinia variegata]|uniref:Uncharacterized protein n=1 Tax=Bauhinia variegata TaxID=167791 RepID=A0ACB9NE44_BAUVA|nr:hypothetical protein L6164_019204 [Bauhinia variegata]
MKKDESTMGTPFFHELKKQASFFLKDKIKTARLALTDVTPAQLMTEEATNGNPWSPDTPTLRSISRAAFELDDFSRIVDILHKRLLKFEKNNWRVSYNSVLVLEHLLTHGPESVAEEFQGDKQKHVIKQMTRFQHIDDKGFNWGLTVRKKSERILKLLEDGTVLKEERNRARKLSREIQGFGSFSQRSTQRETSSSSLSTFGRCNSEFNNHGNMENQVTCSNKDIPQSWDEVESKNYWDDETSFKENMAPISKPNKEESHQGESYPLVDCRKEDSGASFSIEDDHPFYATQNQASASASLLSARDEMLLGY